MILVQFAGSGVHQPGVDEHWRTKPVEVTTVPRIGEEVRLDGWCFRVLDVVHSFGAPAPIYVVLESGE